MFNFVKNLFDPTQAAIKEATPKVNAILEMEEKTAKLSIEEMHENVQSIKEKIKVLVDKIPSESRFSISKQTENEFESIEEEIKKLLQDNLVEVFAYLREINKRKFNKAHYRVQLIASTILAGGNKLAELKTGEGKTQVFHLPSALYGLTGRGSHVITVNDYLAKRDGEYAGHAISDLGISVGIITPQASYKFITDSELEQFKGKEAVKERENLNIAELSQMKGTNLLTCTKQEAYSCDVVYGTNNEFGFDYLRDNMSYDIKSRVQKELYFVIVDEADSILIDEARTPLIISAPAEQSNELFEKFAHIVKKLSVTKHYEVDEKARSVTLTEEGVEYVEKLLNVNNLWEDYQNAHHLDNALKAEVLYKIDDEYIVNNGEIMIVDEFTGRVLPGRRYSEGLHQAIEAKESVEIKRASRTMATITFQNFFKLYKVLAGGSGTIITEAEEFGKIFNLESYAIPTNKPVIRKDLADKIYRDRKAKFNAVVQEIKNINQTGQPILVGTASIEDSEYLSGLLDKSGIKHEVLNAKFHEREAQIVAKAGQKDSVTVATNMAGRGTDIPLGEGVEELGGLYIIGTQRHEARRIDNQLRGRGGRQGQPGTSQFLIALDDEIMRIQGGEVVQKLMKATNLPPDLPIQNPLLSRTIESAQKRMEGANFDIRKRLVDYDNVINQQREIFYTRRFNILKRTNLTDQNNDEIKSDLKNIISSEVENIVDSHFLNKSNPQKELNGLVNDYLDLAKDDLISEVVSKKFANINESSTQKKLLELLKEKSQQEIEETLNSLTEEIISKKLAEFNESSSDIYRITSLQTMDELWTEHLDAIADLREGIGLRSYAQKDPLVEYKNEAFTLFSSFIDSVNSKISRRILKIERVINPQLTNQRTVTNEAEISDVSTGSREMSADSKISKVLESGSKIGTRNQNLGKEKSKTVKKENQIGRNDKVTIRYNDGTIKKDVKYKKVENDIKQGKATIIV